MPKSLKLLSPSEMSELTTPRLLAYKNRLHKAVDGPDWDVQYEGASDDTLHKARAEWKATMEACKAILATRPHSVRKARGPKP
jgi:hypothetical protein